MEEITENISQTISWTCHAFHSNSLQNSSKVLCKRIRVTQKENQIQVQTEGTSWNWRSIQKWLCLVAVQCGMSRSITNVATKFWKLWPSKTKVAQQIDLCPQTVEQEYLMADGWNLCFRVLWAQSLSFTVMKCGLYRAGM